MLFLDKTLDGARDRTAAGRMPRSLALGLILIVLGTGVAYYWNQFAVSVGKGKKGKVAGEAPAGAPAVPGEPRPTDH
jgi:hypothetical protein